MQGNGDFWNQDYCRKMKHFWKNDNLLISWSAYLDWSCQCQAIFWWLLWRFVFTINGSIFDNFYFLMTIFLLFQFTQIFLTFLQFFFQYFNYDFFEIFLICWTIFGGNVFWQFSKLFQIEYFQLSELLIEVPSTLLANYQLKSPFNKL